MNNPEHMTRDQLIKLAKCHKSMIANLQNQLRKALDSNARLYAESHKYANQERPTLP